MLFAKGREGDDGWSVCIPEKLQEHPEMLCRGVMN